MFSMPAMSYGQVLPPVLTAVSQGVSSDTTIGSIPSRVVYSAIAQPELQNQRGGGAAYAAMPTASAMAPASAQQAMQSLTTLSSPGSSPNFSVAFFAQLLGQSNSQTQSQLTMVFKDVVPLQPGDPAVFDVYSEVKYMPSAAAKPLPQPRLAEVEMPQPVKPETAVAEAKVQMQSAPVVTVVMRNSFSYAPVQSTITYTPPARPSSSGQQGQRVLGQKSPAEAYQQAATRKVEAAEDNMDAAA